MAVKTVAIFGGSGGLGKQVAAILQSDYNVVALSSNDCDVRSFEEVAAFFQNREIDIVLNFAGINYDRMLHKVDMVDMKSVRELLDVNVGGAVNIAAAALPGMRLRGYGRIIMISSILAVKDVPGTAVYSSSKAFIDRLVKSISAENASKGVTANSIQLGYFSHGLTEKLPSKENILTNIPFKRFGRIDELFAALKFLIDTEYITGQNINISGGIH